MQLIGSLTSPYVRKVRVVLAEKKLDYRLSLENVWADDTHIQDYNPLGKVPCLVLDGGEALFDSRVIVEYIDTLSPVGKLLPTGGRERAEAKTWEALADGLLDAALAARMERTWDKRAEHERSQAFIDRQMGKIAAALGAMERGLGDKPHCLGGAHQSGRHCRGLRAGLPQLPLCRLGLARRAPSLGAPAGQAGATSQFRRDAAALNPPSDDSHAVWGAG